IIRNPCNRFLASASAFIFETVAYRGPVTKDRGIGVVRRCLRLRCANLRALSGKRQGETRWRRPRQVSVPQPASSLGSAGPGSSRDVCTVLVFLPTWPNAADPNEARCPLAKAIRERLRAAD